MTLKIFAVYDSKVEAYLQPFFMRSRGEALRAFGEACNDPQTGFYKHPADYTLFELGSFDEEKGQITTLTVKMALGTALEYKKQMEIDPKQLPIPLMKEAQPTEVTQ